MNKIKLISTLTILLAITGCTAGLDFKRPDDPQVSRYTAQALKLEKQSSDDLSQQIVMGENLDKAWWELFQSNELNQVVKQALTNNPTIVAAGYTLAQAQDLVVASSGAKYPEVAMTAGVGRQKYGAEFLGSGAKPPPFTYFAIGPTVSYTLDYTGGVARSVEQQYALTDYQQQQLNAAYLSVTGNAVIQSIRIASLNEQIKAIETLLEQDRKNQQLTRNAFNAGAVPRLDIVSAESQLASDAALLPSLRQELSVAQHALAIILGEAPGANVAPEFNLLQLTLPKRIPVSLPSELVHRRPDILSAEAQLHAATAAVGIADSNLYPKITLSASFGQQSTQTSQLFARNSNAWSLISGLTAPIFDGGTLHAEKRAAVNAMHATSARYQQTVLTAFGQVADALQALEHDAEALDAETHARQAATENLDMSRKSYQEGNTGILQVIDAERRYQQASLNYVRAQAQRYIDTAQLFLALGGSNPDNGPTTVTQ